MGTLVEPSHLGMLFDVRMSEKGRLVGVWGGKGLVEGRFGKLIGLPNTIDDRRCLWMVKAISVGAISNNGAMFAMQGYVVSFKMSTPYSAKVP